MGPTTSPRRDGALHQPQRLEGSPWSVRLTDRKKDMTVVGGFKVFPDEVEDVPALYRGVLESAVIGVPDERTAASSARRSF